jgi:hypothetical protein
VLTFLPLFDEGRETSLVINFCEMIFFILWEMLGRPALSFHPDYEDAVIIGLMINFKLLYNLYGHAINIIKSQSTGFGGDMFR